MNGRLQLLVALLLAGGSASCGATGPVIFTGQDIEYARGLAIAGRKDRDRVLVVSGEYDFGISLPYAEDWTFEPAARKPVFGSSKSAEMIVTVQAARTDRKIDEQTYLRDELMGNMRSTFERRGLAIEAVGLRKIGEHYVLEFTAKATVDGRPFQQVHWWGVRRNDHGVVCDIHLSSTCSAEKKLEDLRVAAHSIIGQEFRFVR